MYSHAAAFLIPTNSPDRTTAVLCAFDSALAYLNLVTTPTQTDLLSYAPFPLSTNLVLASYVIIKTLRSSYSTGISGESGQAGRKAFMAALQALGKCSVENNDNAGRAMTMLGQLWCAEGKAGEAEQPPVLRLRSRLVAR